MKKISQFCKRSFTCRVTADTPLALKLWVPRRGSITAYVASSSANLPAKAVTRAQRLWQHRDLKPRSCTASVASAL